MKGGWFIGNFEPSLFPTNDVEVAIKRYAAGAYEASHYHKIATEYTVIIEGEVEMSGKRFVKNDIIIISPNEATDFRVLKDTITAVVKVPGANNDKYIV